MKIILETNSNGIHDYMAITVHDPEIEYIEVLKEILETVEKFNEKQILKA